MEFCSARGWINVATLISQLRGHLRPGYSFTPHAEGGYHVLNPQGELVRTPSGQPIKITDTIQASKHQQRRIYSHLRQANVLMDEKRSHSPAEPNRVKRKKTPANEAISPKEMASLILSDPRATPRERKIAKAYLKIYESHVRVRALAIKFSAEIQRLRVILDNQTKG